jgi:hypothetical protein
MSVGIDELAQLLAFMGLLIGAESYFLLIRRRRNAVREEQAQARDDSRRKAMRRLRHLRRHDEI